MSTQSIILVVQPEIQESRDSKALKRTSSDEVGKSEGRLEEKSNGDAPSEKENLEIQMAEPAVEQFQLDDCILDDLALMGITPPESAVEKKMMSLWYQLTFSPNTSFILQQLCEFNAPYELFAKYKIQSEAMQYWENEEMQPEISSLCHRIEMMKPKKKHCRNLKKQWLKMVEDGEVDSIGPSKDPDSLTTG